jgi:hypothetical protein
LLGFHRLLGSRNSIYAETASQSRFRDRAKHATFKIAVVKGLRER